jgi:hypothetical protein
MVIAKSKDANPVEEPIKEEKVEKQTWSEL